MIISQPTNVSGVADYDAGTCEERPQLWHPGRVNRRVQQAWYKNITPFRVRFSRQEPGSESIDEIKIRGSSSSKTRLLDHSERLDEGYLGTRITAGCYQ